MKKSHTLHSDVVVLLRHTTVLHGDINALLSHAIERHEKSIETGVDESREANQLPPKGTIDFIYCGPPCQVPSGLRSPLTLSTH